MRPDTDYYPSQEAPANALAIVGMACRVPGADSPAEFWDNLRNGIESITTFSDDELIAAGVDPSRLRQSEYVKAKAILRDSDHFDAAFFGFTPREAEILDPQQRAFLECAWSALEDAGYDPESYQGAIGVFAGASLSTYLMHVTSHPEIVETLGEYQVALSNDKDHLTTRVAYKLNLTGPCVSVQTACSTSLVAVHLACQSLLDAECDLALAGGVSIRVPDKTGYLYQEGGIFSPDGHCRAFDANAQGTVEGHGVGLVALKRLDDALADGDQIYAVIRGSAINNDGSLKVGYTAPSEDGQAMVIAEAQAIADTPPDTISYIEAHGTGTALGDPIEVAALNSVFRAASAAPRSCALGSVKPNIGHLDAAAGVAGLIKAALALRHRELPPTLHVTQPNAAIDAADSPFYVNTELRSWQSQRGPRRAGVSSFGIGGTNAHVILEEAPQPTADRSARPWQLLILSAKTERALDTQTTNLATYLRRHPDLDLADVAHTLQVGRRAFEQRRMVVCRDYDDAIAALEAGDPQRIFSATNEQRQRPVVFLFPGQGAQYVTMGAGLYGAESVYRSAIDRCAELFMPHLGRDLRSVIDPDATSAHSAAELLNQTAITQPALFAVEYALARLWMSWGVKPVAMIGHSIGEYVAATLAGVMSLEDAIALVADRGRLMQETPEGAMLAVSLHESEIRPFLTDRIDLAAINGPAQCVVAGPSEAIDALRAELSQRRIECRPVRTARAFHSALMEPIVEPFVEQVRRVQLRPPQIPFISNVTGTWITGEQATDPRYWAQHLRQTVLFAAGLDELIAQPEQLLLEVGPGQTLGSLARRHPNKAESQIVLSSLRHAREQQDDAAFLLTTLGRLWLAGVPIDWPALYANESRRRVSLPTYPFERQRFWIERQIQESRPSASMDKQPDIADWLYMPLWQETPAPRLRSLGEQRRWLIFADRCGLGTELGRQIRSLGGDAISVEIGELFAQRDESTFAIDPRRREDYTRLLESLRSSDLLPTTIVYCWTVTSDADPPDRTTHPLGFDSLLLLAQALGEQGISTPIRLGVVSNHTQEVTGSEALMPEKALALGLCRVIPQEYSGVVCRSIDIELTARTEQLARLLLAELVDDATDSPVAYRGRHRWTQSFKPLHVPEAESLLLRESGVYLIAEGVSVLGLALAEYLAQSVHAAVALTTTLAVPAPADWDRWLQTHDDQDLITRTIQTLRRIEELGGRAMVEQTSLVDREQLDPAIRRIRDRFGPINGVIQAATDHGAGVIHLKTPKMAVQAIAPKVQGTRNLEAALHDLPLDFFALFSSTTAITGGAGLADLCAANSFIQTFARDYAQRTGTQTIAIDWSQWQWDDWQESLMPDGSELRAQLRKIRETYGMTIDESVAAFVRALSVDQPQVIISPQDFATVIDRLHTLNADAMLGDRATAMSAAHPRPILDRAYVAPTNEIEQVIAEMWQEQFGIERVGIYDNFFELGGNSLNGIQLVARLRSVFQVDLAASALFESPTVAALAQVIARQHLDEADLGDIDDLLREIESLSADEIRATLAAEQSEESAP